MIKRVLDIITSGIVIAFFWPVFLIIGMIIKMESPGPIFYRQDRIGYNGRIFRIFKFRKFPQTSNGGPGLTMVRDSRMTKTGKMLERFKLDEFPQFINVFKGEMSIVGPRPETPHFAQYYSEDQKKVLQVKPGIFGVNQLVYRREAALFLGKLDPEQYYIKELMPQKLKNDIAYIERSTVFTDIVILVRCMWSVIIEPFITKFYWTFLVKKNRG